MMRPDAEAVGLICILSYDYSIVKIKMLFRYSVSIINNKLANINSSFSSFPHSTANKLFWNHGANGAAMWVNHFSTQDSM